MDVTMPVRTSTQSSPREKTEWEKLIDCPICRGKGWILKPAAEVGEYPYEAMVKCKCYAKRASFARIRRSGLEDAIKRCTFDNFQTPEPWQETIKRRVQAFAETPKGWLFLGGQSGCGKTHLCTAACGSILGVGLEVRYFLWRDAATRLKAKINGPEYDLEINDYKEVPVLYIDDLFKAGRGAVSDADISLAFELLNYRYNQMDSITIISSEFMLDDIKNFDEAIAGRIRERCAGNILNIARKPERNYRMKQEVI